MNRFTLTFAAGPEHIDVMNHVNNAVWVQWMEALATAHWEAHADPAHVAAYAWVAVRHEIDYRGNIKLGESVKAETFIPDGPRAPGSTGGWISATPLARSSSPHGRPGRWSIVTRASCCACRPRSPHPFCLRQSYSPNPSVLSLSKDCLFFERSAESKGRPFDKLRADGWRFNQSCF
jgi:hypothetical protein